eukprot:8803955-Heterocapsa_arctica.AAC.1
MNLNIASMGRMVEDLKYSIIWSPDPGHGALWRIPETGSWVRLVVENFVPMLTPHDDQTGIEKALQEIFFGKTGVGSPAPILSSTTFAAAPAR